MDRINQGRACARSPAGQPDRLSRATLGTPRSARSAARIRTFATIRTSRSCSNRGDEPSEPCCRSSRRPTSPASAPAGWRTSSRPRDLFDEPQRGHSDLCSPRRRGDRLPKPLTRAIDEWCSATSWANATASPFAAERTIVSIAARSRASTSVMLGRCASDRECPSQGRYPNAPCRLTASCRPTIEGPADCPCVGLCRDTHGAATAEPSEW